MIHLWIIFMNYSDKYNYPLSDYLRDFIYEFDRQDEESVFYLIKEIIENKNFLNYG